MKPMELMDALGELPPELVEPVLSGQPIARSAESSSEIEDILTEDAAPILQSKPHSGGVMSKVLPLAALAACAALSFGVVKLIGSMQQDHNQMQGSGQPVPAATGTDNIPAEPAFVLPDEVKEHPELLVMLNRLAEKEECRLEDCIILCHSGENMAQLLTPNKVYTIEPKRSSSFRIFTADGTEPDFAAILDEWRAYLGKHGCPADILEQQVLACTPDESDGGWIVEADSVWLDFTLADVLQNMPDISHIDAQYSYHSDDILNTAGDYKWHILCSRPVTAEDFPALNGASVKILSEDDVSFTLKLPTDNYTDYFSAASYLRSLDFVTKMYLSYTRTELGGGIEYDELIGWQVLYQRDADAQTTTAVNNERTPLDTVAPDGVPIRSSVKYTEEEKAEIMEAYEALKRFMDNYLNVNIPGASKYLTSVDDVVYDYDLYTHYDSSVMHFHPEEELRFSVTCAEKEELSSSYHGGIGYLVSKIDGKWTTYTEYTSQPEHQTAVVTATTDPTTQTMVNPQDVRTITVEPGNFSVWHDFATTSAENYADFNETVRISAFPDVIFHWDGSQSMLTISGQAEKPLIFAGMPIWNAFFADVTKDGQPDLCFSCSMGSGMINEQVTVYDIANQKSYTLSERGSYDYLFREKDGKLVMLKYPNQFGAMDAVTGFPIIQDGALCFSADGKSAQ